jgi:Spherulation-specific family 4
MGTVVQRVSTILLQFLIKLVVVGQWEITNDSTSVESHPQVKFIVVVNPSSGPGTSQYPNDDYTTQIQQLNAYQNVNTLGYVRTGYATRDIKTVVSEVSTYAGWASKSGDLAMHGIFFDEAPHQFSEAAVEFMLVANEAVKNAEGLQGQKTVRDTPDLVPIRLHNHSILLTISLFRR